VEQREPAARDLAIRGARALLEDQARRNELLGDLAEWSTGDDPPWDPDVLGRIDKLTFE
jgi:hypothetical protein